jgi:hypothetical protein
VFREELRRKRARQQRRRQALAALLTGAILAAALFVLLGFRPQATRRAQATPRPRPQVVHRRPRRPSLRPPQFLVVSFDGSGGDRLWTYWRPLASRAHAHFTFFVSGVYLLDEARRRLYHPPRHPAGVSDIGFAQPDGRRSAGAVVRATLEQIAGAYRDGNEIGTHYDGHFCAPYAGNVGEWNASDWQVELNEFDALLFGANENNHLRHPVDLGFGPEEVVGGRTPCLQGKLRLLYPVLAARGFRYDASQVARLGAWPQRELGIWSVPLLEIPFVHHTYRVISMDYNFFANQTGAVSGPPASSREIEDETYLSLWRAFRTSYFGNRAPFSVANHFETWNNWAYDHALSRFVLRACALPEVRCVSFRELVDWLDAQPRRRLRRYRLGRFPRLRSVNPG